MVGQTVLNNSILLDHMYYVPHESLQDCTKLHKYDVRSRVGVCIGQSKEHASNISYVLNTKIKHMRPQYYITCKHEFTTVTTTSDIGK